MTNILIGILIWQFITSIVAINSNNEMTIARVGCGVWWLLWQGLLIIKEIFKKQLAQNKIKKDGTRV